MADNFDLGPHADVLDGTLTARIIDNDEHESTVLNNDVANGIRVRWHTDGLFAPLINPDCTWQIEACFEGISGAPEFTVTRDPVNYQPGPHGAVIPLPAGQIQAGAYKVVVLMSLLMPGGGLTFINGFVEIPMVRFRE